MFVKKLHLEYRKVIKTYLPTYLWDSSDSSDSHESSDSSDIIDISDISDSRDSSDSSDSCDKNVVTKMLLLKFNDYIFVTKIVWLKLCD